MNDVTAHLYMYSIDYMVKSNTMFEQDCRRYSFSISIHIAPAFHSPQWFPLNTFHSTSLMCHFWRAIALSNERRLVRCSYYFGSQGFMAFCFTRCCLRLALSFPPKPVVRTLLVFISIVCSCSLADDGTKGDTWWTDKVLVKFMFIGWRSVGIKRFFIYTKESVVWLLTFW